MSELRSEVVLRQRAENVWSVLVWGLWREQKQI
ncbi:hypothetical protein CIB84_015261 [Bambusicola thoracicus]|uniref:Uncharacterized protein n=1 Tax=Bambusicola thoracicus TaxID=9083 RepID=A0A2P4SA45_BAMTH|nr:hypothetical protein CIB84_015261 [Bambusicola thoracicus]